MSILRRYPHFIAFVCVTAIVTVGLASILHPARALLAGFDCGALVFLLLLIGKFRHEAPDDMRGNAARNEPDHHTLTAFALFIVGIVLTAVWVEISGDGGHRASGIALAAITLAFAWLFANTLFALHYAHIYYLKGSPGGDRGGLAFPGDDKNPDHWDFAYFAFVLGMTFQVSDVVITAKRVRRLALLHAMLAFLFNIAVVALSVSVVSVALGG